MDRQLTSPKQFNSLLYYPYINLPKERWVINAVLYYDKVGIIAPKGYDYDSLTQNFIDFALVAAVSPYDYLDLQTNDFRDGFMRIVEHKDFEKQKRKKEFDDGKVTRIFAAKFNMDVLKALEKIGLALIIKPQMSEVLVETITANVYMQYLATKIGAALQFTPSTNNIASLDSLKPIISINYNMDLNKVFDQIFPIPLDSDYRKIAEFKDKHYDKLLSFRNKVEGACIQSCILPTELREKALSNFINEAKREQAEIIEYMRKFEFLRIGLGAVKMLIPALKLASSKGLSLLDLLPEASAVIDGSVKIVDNFKKDKYSRNPFYYSALLHESIQA